MIQLLPSIFLALGTHYRVDRERRQVTFRVRLQILLQRVSRRAARWHQRRGTLQFVQCLVTESAHNAWKVVRSSSLTSHNEADTEGDLNSARTVNSSQSYGTSQLAETD
jgi:hypothetical protein